MDITIYQINSDRDLDLVTFINYEGTQRLQNRPGINSSIYDRVYKGFFENVDLEDIYRIFNCDHPEDYRGRSLSVSDIVEVSDGPQEKSSFYFCDSIGFKRVDFDPQKTQDFYLANFKSEREPEYYHLEARLGIGLQVTPEEFEVLKRGDAEAHKLLASLVQSDRCTIGGDTYFPGPWNEDYLKDDLNFDLPSMPLLPAQAKKPSLDQQIQHSQSRTTSLSGIEKPKDTEFEH